jgi:hypothetical protein
VQVIVPTWIGTGYTVKKNYSQPEIVWLVLSLLIFANLYLQCMIFYSLTHITETLLTKAS